MGLPGSMRFQRGIASRRDEGEITFRVLRLSAAFLAFWLNSFVLEVTDVNDCLFTGTTTYGSEFNNHVLNISGTMDKYGWITFKETSVNFDGGIITDCVEPFEDNWWCSDCESWPNGRMLPVISFVEGRYSNDPFEWVGEIRTEGWNSIPRPCSNISNIPGGVTAYEGQISGNYKVVKQ